MNALRGTTAACLAAVALFCAVPIAPGCDGPERPIPVEARARGRAQEISVEARDAVARAFAALDPSRRLFAMFARALDDEVRDESFRSAFHGRRIVLRYEGDAWSYREDAGDGPWQDAGKLPLGTAINAAGPWGRVTVPAGAPPVAGGSMGRASWNSAAATHPGPVLVEGGKLLGVASQGTGAPALWLHRCEILGPPGAKAAFEVHGGVPLGAPWAFTDCTFGALDPKHRGWGPYPMLWGVRAYAQGPLAFVRCKFLEHTSEHSIYVSNVQGALWIAGCDFETSPRTNVQVTNRVREGPPGIGPIAIVRTKLAIARKAHGGPGGGGSVTVAGHHGPIALLDLDFRTGRSSHAFDSHNALVVVWGEPTPGGNGGAHLLPDGWWMPELAVAGLRLVGEPADGPYLADREAVVLSGVREVWFEAPASTRVPVRGFGTTGSRAGRILVNAHDPSGVEGQNIAIGVLRWDALDDGGSPWWHVVGGGWASSLPARPQQGEYGPLRQDR